jgi:hypothetical protein
LPHDLYWRPSKDRLLVRRRQDLDAKNAYLREAKRNRTTGAMPPFDSWPLDDADWMLAADIGGLIKTRRPVPTAWDAAKLRRWQATLQRTGQGQTTEAQQVRDRLRVAETKWRAEVEQYFATVGPPADLSAVLAFLELDDDASADGAGESGTAEGEGGAVSSATAEQAKPGGDDPRGPPSRAAG